MNALVDLEHGEGELSLLAGRCEHGGRLYTRGIHEIEVYIVEIDEPVVGGLEVLDRDGLSCLGHGEAATAPHDVVVQQYLGRLVR